MIRSSSALAVILLLLPEAAPIPETMMEAIHQGPGYGPSPDEPALPMEYHDEAPPPGGPPGAPGAVPQFSNLDQVLSPPMPWPSPATPIVPVPTPPHPQFPLPQLRRVCGRLLQGMSLRHVHGAHPDDVSEAKARAAHPVVVVQWLSPKQNNLRR